MFKLFIALIGGLLMGLTTAPISAFYLAWIALVPLWILVIKKGQNIKQNILLAFAWGCGYHGLALFWITGIHPMTWMGVPWLASLGIAVFCWIFITLWGAALVIIWSVGMTIFNQTKYRTNSFSGEPGQYCSVSDVQSLTEQYWEPGGQQLIRILFGVSLWCGLEALWSMGSLWWSSLSYTQSPHNLLILQLSQLSGPSTVTASLIAVNGLIAELLLKVKHQKIRKGFLLLIPLTLCLSLHLIGFWLYNRPVITSDKEAIKVGLIQGNIPNEIKLYYEGWRKAIEGYTTGYEKLVTQSVDIVLTPETALPFFWDDLVHGSSLYLAILTHKIPVWLGAFGQQGKSFTNSLFTVTGKGEIFSRYDKVKLVPLGEYIPFEEILGKLINRLSPLDAHLARGNPQQIFDTPFGRAIVGICYESAFSEHFRRQTRAGGEFIITASNNAHYSNSMPAQHHAQDVMRAIESDRWAARATNTGYSAIVDPRGRTLWISGINTYELYMDTIYRRQTQTLYVKYGDWLTLILIILIILKISAGARSQFKSHERR